MIFVLEVAPTGNKGPSSSVATHIFSHLASIIQIICRNLPKQVVASDSYLLYYLCFSWFQCHNDIKSITRFLLEIRLEVFKTIKYIVLPNKCFGLFKGIWKNVSYREICIITLPLFCNNYLIDIFCLEMCSYMSLYVFNFFDGTVNLKQ